MKKYILSLSLLVCVVGYLSQVKVEPVIVFLFEYAMACLEETIEGINSSNSQCSKCVIPDEADNTIAPDACEKLDKVFESVSLMSEHSNCVIPDEADNTIAPDACTMLEKLYEYTHLPSPDAKLLDKPFFTETAAGGLLEYYIANSNECNKEVLSAIKIICWLTAVAAVSKSAQAGLHIWLPEAMEGPTPVSSLIHAATMVTAGIFLLVRCSYLFTDIGTLYVYMILIGSVTAFFSSTIGLLQNDIKKIVAYSTCSQLGYMFVCCGFAAYNNSMYHLVNHAFFKALLFLTAGYIIHAIGNEQDIRKMGGMLKILPLQYAMMLIGSLSLVGFPFFSGFYSKDKIIELCFNNYMHLFDMICTYKYIMFAQIFCLLAVICTLIYSIKLLFYVFINSYCGFKKYVINIHFTGMYIQIPLLILSCLSITSGYVTSDMMVGVGTDFWIKSFQADTFILPEQMNIFKARFLLHTEFDSYIRNITVVWTMYFLSNSIILMVSFQYFFIHASTGALLWLRQLFQMICKKYIFINRIIVFPSIIKMMHTSYEVMYKCFDKGILEFIGPFGIVHSIKQLMISQRLLQTGLIYHYAGIIFIWAMIVAAWFGTNEILSAN